MGRTPLILVVDDELHFRSLIKENFEDQGFNVLEAENGKEALLVFEEHRPDLVLLDLIMPKMDGYETCRRIRASPNGTVVPILIITCINDFKGIRKAFDMGATDFTTKPVNLLILTERVRFMIRASRTAQELKESNDFLAQAQSLAQLGNFVSLPDQLTLTCSDRFRYLCGFSEPERPVTWDAFMNKVHPQDRSSLDPLLQQTLSQGTPLQLDIRLDNGLAEACFFMLRIDAETNSDGQVVKLLGTIQDITDRKQAVEALKKSEEKQRAIFDANPNPVVVTDAKGRLECSNPAFSETFGWTMEELKGKEIPFVPDDQQEMTAAKLQEIATYGRPIRFLSRRLSKHGDILEVIVSAAIIKGPEDSIAGLVVNLTDVTEQRKLEDQLQQALKMESVGRLAGGVAHDLNNMLVAILGYGELLLDDQRLDEELKRKISLMHQAGQRSRDLVEQLLAFSRKQTLRMEWLDLNEVICNFKGLLQKTIRENIEVQFNLSPGLPAVKADQSQLEQVILNLALNAQDSMPDGGGLTFETQATELDESQAASHVDVLPGRYVLLMVSDTGQGMDRETQEHIFEPFFTTKGVGKGTGLGLATVYGIVKQHQGHIWVSSEPDHGATFEILLPAADTPRGRNARRVGEEKQDTRGQETVLVAEDETTVRELTVSVLQNQGYQVLFAANGTQSLQLLDEWDGSLSLLITDVIMPDMNGKILFEYVRLRHPHVRVLYMSGYARDGITHQGVLDQGVDFIQKPFSVQDLCMKVRKVLDRHSTI